MTNVELTSFCQGDGMGSLVSLTMANTPLLLGLATLILVFVLTTNRWLWLASMVMLAAIVAVGVFFIGRELDWLLLFNIVNKFPILLLAIWALFYFLGIAFCAKAAYSLVLSEVIIRRPKD